MPCYADVVDADIALWTSAFVFLTLIVNAPTISTVLNLLKLNKIPREKLKMRRWGSHLGALVC